MRLAWTSTLKRMSYRDSRVDRRIELTASWNAKSYVETQVCSR